MTQNEFRDINGLYPKKISAYLIIGVTEPSTFNNLKYDNQLFQRRKNQTSIVCIRLQVPLSPELVWGT